MKVAKYWEKTSFWVKVKDTLGLFGPTGEIIMIAKEVNPSLQIVLTFLGLIGYAVAIWMEDKDGNGLVDILEDKPTL